MEVTYNIGLKIENVRILSVTPVYHKSYDFITWYHVVYFDIKEDRANSINIDNLIEIEQYEPTFDDR